MSREWQQTKYKGLVLPDAVYYQSIWAVRDLQRMEARLAELEQEEMLMKGGSIVCDRSSNFAMRRPTEDFALEKAVLKDRIQGIRSALESVPAEFRSFILSNLIFKTSGKGYPDKTWKYWKQRFLHDVAKNLSMV